MTRFTEEQVDFLKEMMNVGAGNAATALEQILNCEIVLRVPKVEMLPPSKAVSAIGAPGMAVSCVKMAMVGDIMGTIFFIIGEEAKRRLILLAEEKAGLPAEGREVSVLEEIGNILTGVYLVSIHDFCGLNIYHTVPELASDMLRPIMDETVLSMSGGAQTALIVINEFVLVEKEGSPVRAFLLIIPQAASIDRLAEAVERARERMGG